MPRKLQHQGVVSFDYRALALAVYLAARILARQVAHGEALRGSLFQKPFVYELIFDVGMS